MPQLDIAFFPTQVIWLFITFAILYIVMARVALPRIASMLEARQERIELDLSKAERLKREAGEVLVAYEKSMADARAKATDLLRESAEASAREADKRQGELSKKLSAETAAAEARILDAKNKAIGDIRNVAEGIAQDIAAKLSGKAMDDKLVRQAVESAMKEQG